MPDERILVVVPAEQREIAARLTQRVHFAHVHVGAANRLAQPRTGSAHIAVEHIAMSCEFARALHGVRRVGGHFAQAIVEFLRRNVLEGDRRHRLPVAIAPAQLALHALQPFDGFRRGCAVAVGISQIPAARIRRVFRVFGDRLPSVAVTRVCRVGVIARIDHHHAHCDAPRTVGRFDRQRERARFERQRRRAGDGIHTAGKLAVKIVLFVGEDAALEIMVAVRRCEGDMRFQRRPQKRGECVAHFLPCLVEQ